MRRRLFALGACAVALCGAANAAAHVPTLPGVLAAGETPPAVPALAPDCERGHDDFASASELMTDNRVMSDFGPRPTASKAHARFVDWLERQMSRVPDVQIDSASYTIDRWQEKTSALAAGGHEGALEPLASAGAVPYSRPTGAEGVTAPLAYVPPEVPLVEDDIAGKIVLRDVVPGRTPYRNYNAVQWFKYDPDLSLTRAEASGGASESDATGANRRIVDDLTAAAAGGAAGVIFVHGLPRSQVAGHYAPYDGIRWKVPALYVGADEGSVLTALAERAGRARIALSATQNPRAETRMLIATLPGASPERFVIQSHTDGINALWDNGPIAMLALARHFAALPQRCRPRTLQFVFTTAHLYQYLGGESGAKGGSAAVMAEQLDEEYEKGSVAMVLALEHLGAREYAAVPRADGGPGRELAPTGETEINTFFSGESPAIVGAATHAIVSRDLPRTYLLRGADAPAARIPPHESFGGEGSSYQRRLIPTFAFITGPWTLFKPRFGMEALDGDLMRKQALVFRDVVQGLFDTPTAALGGGYVGERAARTLICSSALSTMGFMTCEGDDSR